MEEKTLFSREQLAAWAQSGRLYAVLDACDSPALQERLPELGYLSSEVAEERRKLSPETAHALGLPLLEELPVRATCLYQGEAEEDLAAFAPYLVAVDAGLLDWASALVAQEGGGLFLVSDATLDALRTHLRRFLLVLAPNGEEMYFRYYDARILPKFLAVCTEEERRDLFGPILAFGLILEDESLLLTERAGPMPETAPPRPPRTGLFQTRPAHLAAFAEEAERAFALRVVEHLRAYHSRLVNLFPDAVLMEMVRHGVGRGRSYGLSSEADLTAFVAIMFEIAPNFDRYPSIHRVLTDPSLPSRQKMVALGQRVPDGDWDNAEQNYDADAWFQTPEKI